MKSQNQKLLEQIERYGKFFMPSEVLEGTSSQDDSLYYVVKYKTSTLLQNRKNDAIVGLKSENKPFSFDGSNSLLHAFISVEVMHVGNPESVYFWIEPVVKPN